MRQDTLIDALVRMARNPLRLASIAAIFLLSACSSQVELIEPLDATTVPAANEGIVVARVINATRYPAPLNQLTVAPQNLNAAEGEKFQRLLSKRPRLNGTTVFASPMAAGKYSLTSLRAFHSNGEFYYQHFVPGGTDQGTFDVRPGQVTDLGLLVYYQRSDGDKFYKEIIRVPGESGEVLDKFFSFYEADPSAMDSWDDDGLDDDRNTFFASAAQNPTAFEDPYIAPDGAVYFLGKLGVILKRTAERDWELDVVDTNLDLTAIAQNERGDLVVGGSEGRVFIKQAGGEWNDLSIDHRYDVEHLMFKDADTIDMIALQRMKLGVFRTDIGAPALGWEELNAYETARGWKSSPPPADDDKSDKKQPRPLQMIRTELHDINGQDYLRVYTMGRNANPLFGRAKSRDFAYDAETWKTSVPETKPDFITVVPAGKSKIGIKVPGFWSWSGRTTYSRYVASTDSWEEMNTFAYRCEGELTTSPTCGKGKSGQPAASKKARFTFRSAPWFYSEKEALVFVTFTNRDFWSGETDYDVKLMETSDGGLTWADTGRSRPNEYCATFVTEVSDRLLLSCGNTGDFYESTDLGESWEHVREHESF